MDNSLIRTIQNHPGLRAINIISLIALLALNVLMVIAWFPSYFGLVFISLESVLFIINVLFYILSEEQR